MIDYGTTSRRKWLTKSVPARGFASGVPSARKNQLARAVLARPWSKNDMIRSSSASLPRVLRTVLAFSAVLVAGSGCGPEVEVLTGDTGGESGLGGTAGASGVVAGTGGTAPGGA